MNARKIKSFLGNCIRVFILLCFFLSATLPLFWIFVTSIKSGTELYASVCCPTAISDSISRTRFSSL